MRRLTCFALLVLPYVVGCASMKESDTARTGVEQLLVSSAIDRSLDKVDFRPVAGAKVYVEQKYLDCVDKNYVVVSLHQRLMRNGCTLVDKQEDSQVTMEVVSGGVGTDRQGLFVGIPKMSVPVPLPISTPEISFFSRNRANGTAKITIVAFDTTSKVAVLNGGPQLARSDLKSWNVLGAGHVVSGSVPDEIKKATGESESSLQVTESIASGVTGLRR